MARRSLVFLVTAIIATIEMFGGMAMSVVPGWHTMIIAPYAVLALILLAWLYINSIGYYILERRNRQVSRNVFTAHLVLTLLYFFFSNGVYPGADSYPSLGLGILLGLFVLGQLVGWIAISRELLKQTV